MFSKKTQVLNKVFLNVYTKSENKSSFLIFFVGLIFFNNVFLPLAYFLKKLFLS